MLKDITPRREDERSPIGRLIAAVAGRDTGGPKKVADGVWLFGHWNPEFDVREKLIELWKLEMDRDKGEDRLKSYVARLNDEEERYARDFPGVEYHPLSEFGVCDGWEQITARWPHLIKDLEAYVIAMVEMRREDQSPEGGWRWHKWGEYIGTQKPEHEYLYDDKHIDVVYTYHIYRLEAE